MRGELQSAGARVAAERQQTEQQAEMLMEQLAIAQTVSADTKVQLGLSSHALSAVVMTCQLEHHWLLGVVWCNSTSLHPPVILPLCVCNGLYSHVPLVLPLIECFCSFHDCHMCSLDAMSAFHACLHTSGHLAKCKR